MVDLHLHTNYSDGTDTVKELLINAEMQKLNIISITDHDSIDAYKELENSEIRNLFSGKIIVGIELKTYYNGIPMEVLGYGIDYQKIKINKIDIYDIQVNSLKELKKRAKKLELIFDEKINVSKTDPRRKFASYVFATELLKHEENKKILLSIGPAFTETSFYRVHTSNKNSIFYYDESKCGIPLKEAIDIIHNAGGLAFLAHPLVYPFEEESKLNEIELILKNYELDGLECEYPLFSSEEREGLKNIASKYKKYVSGGTDYHANNKPNINIGTGINNNIHITNQYIDKWIDKVKKI